MKSIDKKILYDDDIKKALVAYINNQEQSKMYEFDDLIKIDVDTDEERRTFTLVVEMKQREGLIKCQ